MSTKTAKIKYTAKHAGHTFTRSSHRTYTHAVLVFSSADSLIAYETSRPSYVKFPLANRLAGIHDQIAKANELTGGQNGAGLWYLRGFCGSLALAQKSASVRGNPTYRVVIVPVEVA